MVSINDIRKLANTVENEFPEGSEEHKLALKVLNSIYWRPVSSPPPLTENEALYHLESVPVIGQFKSGRLAFIKWRQYNDGEDLGEVRIYTDCSEGWEVTKDIVFWQYGPESKL